jgi:hypothetical protein
MAPSFDNLSEDEFDVEDINFDGKKLKFPRLAYPSATG